MGHHHHHKKEKECNQCNQCMPNVLQNLRTGIGGTIGVPVPISAVVFRRPGLQNIPRYIYQANIASNTNNAGGDHWN
jgi:hypothetical protein